MNPKFAIQFAAFSGASAVALGAFGAHALKARISVELMSAYHTAVQYHFIHTLVLLCLGVIMVVRPNGSRCLVVSAWLFGAGILLFSGSLYIMALTGITRFGIITPLGGVSFIVAWLLLLFGVRALFDSYHEA